MLFGIYLALVMMASVDSLVPAAELFSSLNNSLPPPPSSSGTVTVKSPPARASIPAVIPTTTLSSIRRRIIQTDDQDFELINDPEVNSLPDSSPLKKTTKKVRHHHNWSGQKSPSAGIIHTQNVPVTSSTIRPSHFWRNNDILSSASSAPPYDKLDTCDQLSAGIPAGSCPPPYRLLEQRKEYEIRWYPSNKWASAIIMADGEPDGSADGRLFALWEGLAKLEDYFGGHNEPGLAMNLTYPLLMQIKHGKHPGILTQELRDLTVSVPVPARHQLNPPSPVNSDVLLDVVDASSIFVHSFRARIWEVTDRAIRHRVDKFMKLLRNHGEAFHDRYFYLASFSKPINTEKNLYEIWIHAPRLRDPGGVNLSAVPHRRDPPMNKATSRTMKRLCRGVECPTFDVLRSYKFGIQKRRYFDTVLVQADTTECEFNSLSIWRGFMPLHLYKHGINSHWEVLETTRPIGIVHVQDRNLTTARGLNNSSNNCRHDLTVSLYLPKRLHSNPPKAGIGAPSVKINRVNDLIVYVQTVGGSVLDPIRSSIEVRKFGSRLQSLGLCYRRGEHYLVIYDFMVRFHGRQNEIWMLADRCPASQRKP